MIYFPQLSTGATGQFPLRRMRVARTVVNSSAEDYQVKFADPGSQRTEWHLTFDELNDQELAALESLFQAAEGRLQSFTFLDPTDNLLAWSEALTEAVWQADPLLTVTGGLADPMGGVGAFRIGNPTAATLGIRQLMEAPASLEYCLSVYARSDSAGVVRLERGTDRDACPIGTAWMRVTATGQLQTGGAAARFGLALDPGSVVEVFGFQVEAQGGASAYKKTAETGGVYPNARFRDDVLKVTDTGPGRHSCELDIVNADHL